MFGEQFKDMDYCHEIVEEYINSIRNEIIEEYINNIRKTPSGTMSAVMGWVAECHPLSQVTGIIVAGFLLIGFGVLVYKFIQRGYQLKRITEEHDRIVEYCGIVEVDRNITEDDRDTKNEQLNTATSRRIFVTMDNGTRIAMENGTRITTTNGLVITREDDEVRMGTAVARSFAGVRLTNAG